MPCDLPPPGPCTLTLTPTGCSYFWDLFRFTRLVELEHVDKQCIFAGMVPYNHTPGAEGGRQAGAGHGELSTCSSCRRICNQCYYVGLDTAPSQTGSTICILCAG